MIMNGFNIDVNVIYVPFLDVTFLNDQHVTHNTFKIKPQTMPNLL